MSNGDNKASKIKQRYIDKGFLSGWIDETPVNNMQILRDNTESLGVSKSVQYLMYLGDIQSKLVSTTKAKEYTEGKGGASMAGLFPFGKTVAEGNVRYSGDLYKDYGPESWEGIGRDGRFGKGANPATIASIVGLATAASVKGGGGVGSLLPLMLSGDFIFGRVKDHKPGLFKNYQVYEIDGMPVLDFGGPSVYSINLATEGDPELTEYFKGDLVENSRPSDIVFSNVNVGNNAIAYGTKGNVLSGEQQMAIYNDYAMWGRNVSVTDVQVSKYPTDEEKWRAKNLVYEVSDLVTSKIDKNRINDVLKFYKQDSIYDTKTERYGTIRDFEEIKRENLSFLEHVLEEGVGNTLEVDRFPPDSRWASEGPMYKNRYKGSPPDFEAGFKDSYRKLPHLLSRQGDKNQWFQVPSFIEWAESPDLEAQLRETEASKELRSAEQGGFLKTMGTKFIDKIINLFQK